MQSPLADQIHLREKERAYSEERGDGARGGKGRVASGCRCHCLLCSCSPLGSGSVPCCSFCSCRPPGLPLLTKTGAFDAHSLAFSRNLLPFPPGSLGPRSISAAWRWLAWERACWPLGGGLDGWRAGPGWGGVGEVGAVSGQKMRRDWGISGGRLGVGELLNLEWALCSWLLLSSGVHSVISVDSSLISHRCCYSVWGRGGKRAVRGSSVPRVSHLDSGP